MIAEIVGTAAIGAVLFFTAAYLDKRAAKSKKKLESVCKKVKRIPDFNGDKK